MESAGDSLLSPDSLFGAGNEIDNLKFELQNEYRNRDVARHHNKELERSVLELEVRLLKPNEAHETEWDDMIAKQTTHNDMLKSKNAQLRDELAQLKKKLKDEKVCGKECNLQHSELNPNLEHMTENELLKTVKRLDRARTDLKSTLLNKQWTLDTHAKQYHRLTAQRDFLQNELFHLRHAFGKHKKMATCL